MDPNYLSASIVNGLTQGQSLQKSITSYEGANVKSMNFAEKLKIAHQL